MTPTADGFPPPPPPPPPSQTQTQTQPTRHHEDVDVSELGDSRRIANIPDLRHAQALPSSRIRVPVENDVNVPVSARAGLRSALIAESRSHVHAGYLHRQQRKGRSYFGAEKYAWVWTYFIVRNGALQRFDDIHQMQGDRPTIVYPLGGTTITIKDGDAKIIYISFPKSSGIKKPLTLRADTEEDATTWHGALSKQCKKVTNGRQSLPESSGDFSQHDLEEAVPLQNVGGKLSQDVMEDKALVEEALTFKVNGAAVSYATCGVVSHFAINPSEHACDEWDDFINVELELDNELDNELVEHSANDKIKADVSLSYDEDADDFEVLNGTYCVTQAGTWLLKVMYQGYHVFGSPFKIAVKASSPDPMTSTASGDGLFRMEHAGASQTVVVHVRDKFGNMCAWEPSEEEDPLKVDAQFSLVKSDQYASEIDAHETYQCHVESSGFGSYNVTYTCPSDHPHLSKSSGVLQILLNGVEIRDSPFYPQLDVRGRIQSLLQLKRRPSLQDLKSRGLLKAEESAEKVSDTLEGSFKRRRELLLNSLAQTGAEGLDLGIQHSPSVKNETNNIASSDYGTNKYQSMWAASGLGTSNHINYSIGLESSTSASVTGAYKPRPSPWASTEELCKWLPVRRKFIHEKLSLLISPTKSEETGSEGVGFTLWKHNQLTFSKVLDGSSAMNAVSWSELERTSFIDLLEVIEASNLGREEKQTICDLMTDYVEVQMQLSASLQSTSSVWRPAETRRNPSENQKKKEAFQSPDPGIVPIVTRSLYSASDSNNTEQHEDELTLRERFHVSLAKAKESTAIESPPSRAEKQVYGSEYGMVGMYQSQEVTYATPIISAMKPSTNKFSKISEGGTRKDKVSTGGNLATTLLRESAARAAKTPASRSSPEKIDDLLRRLVHDPWNDEEKLHDIANDEEIRQLEPENSAAVLNHEFVGNQEYRPEEANFRDDETFSATAPVGYALESSAETHYSHLPTFGQELNQHDSDRPKDHTEDLQTEGTSEEADGMSNNDVEEDGFGQNSYHDLYLQTKVQESSPKNTGNLIDNAGTLSSEVKMPDKSFSDISNTGGSEVNSYHMQYIIKSTPQQKRHHVARKGKYSTKVKVQEKKKPKQKSTKKKKSTKKNDHVENGKPGDSVKVGSHVTVVVRRKDENAIVAYVGETQFAPGMWYGLRLERAVGKNNGTIKGVRYFQAEARRGLFVKRSSITPVPRLPHEHRRMWRQNEEQKNSKNISSFSRKNDSAHKSSGISQVATSHNEISESKSRVSHPTPRRRIDKKTDDALFDLLKDGLETVWQMQSGAKLNSPLSQSEMPLTSRPKAKFSKSNAFRYKTATNPESSAGSIQNSQSTKSYSSSSEVAMQHGIREESSTSSRTPSTHARGSGSVQGVHKNRSSVPGSESKHSNPFPKSPVIDQGQSTSFVAHTKITLSDAKQAGTKIDPQIQLSTKTSKRGESIGTLAKSVDSPKNIAMRLLGPPPPSLDLRPPGDAVFSAVHGSNTLADSTRTHENGPNIEGGISNSFIVGGADDSPAGKSGNPVRKGGDPGQVNASEMVTSLLTNLGLGHLLDELSLKPYFGSLEMLGSLPNSVLSASGLDSRDKGALIGAVAAVKANLADNKEVQERSQSQNFQETAPKRAPRKPPKRAPPPPPPLA